MTSGNLAKSAFAEYAADRGHVIDFGTPEVVDSHRQFHQRCLLESWHIRSQGTTLNREEGNLPLYTTNIFPEQATRTPPQGPTDSAYLLVTPSPLSLPMNHAILHSFSIKFNVYSIFSFCKYLTFIVFITITTFHTLSFFPPNQVYLNVPVFCNSLLIMTLIWIKTSNKIDKFHLSDPWLV